MLVGLVGLILIFVLAGALYGFKQRGEGSKTWRLARPMSFAKTPLGTYSISLAQALFWTSILIWAGIFVSYSRYELVLVPTQMLVLAGIAGSTALTAKAAAMVRIREIPQQYQRLVKVREPRWGDMISIGGQPNLFKFQIFAFTLIVGAQVILSIFKTGTFPHLDDNILALMGISGGAYVANELAGPSKWKDIREKLTKLKKLKEDSAAAALNVPVPKATPAGVKEKHETEAEKKYAALRKQITELDDEIKKELRAI